ncbi:hypothetical protein [Burkholderia gladioli]|uniref:hypothetical protein n=1 Tax=Burkholderia gladioli TaxID=28095 RepID=UPI001FC7F52A|nr:hypothetical protein [Burkholderia gladioli]
MSTTSTAAPQKVHETKVAIMPLVTIAKEDAGSALDRFDQWLKSVSDGYVTLARVEQLASYIPVVSNIISAVDVVLDIKRLIEAQHKDFFDYLNLGIDLIGIIPVPPVMGEFRTGARPLLKLARQELERSAVAVADGGAQMIADAVISVLVSHLSTKFAGEVEAFIQQVKAKLQQLLDDCANHAHQLLEGLAQIFEKAASGALFDTSGNERAAAQHLKQAGDGFAAHDAGKIAHSLWSYLEDGAKEFVKDTANVATKAANFISPSTNEKLRHLAATARGAIPMVTSKIKGLNSSDVGGLMWLLNPTRRPGADPVRARRPASRSTAQAGQPRRAGHEIRSRGSARGKLGAAPGREGAVHRAQLSLRPGRPSRADRRQPQGREPLPLRSGGSSGGSARAGRQGALRLRSGQQSARHARPRAGAHRADYPQRPSP